MERLRSGIYGDEFNILDAFVDHVVDGIAATTTDTHHANSGRVLGIVIKHEARVNSVVHELSSCCGSLCAL